MLALGVQAIFLLMPEPKSAGATDPEAPTAIAAMDSTAFTLAEDETVLPGTLAADSTQMISPDSLRTAALPTDSTGKQPAAQALPDSATVTPDSSAAPLQ